MSFPVLVLSSTAIGNIVGPTGGMQVYSSSNTGPYQYGTITNSTLYQNTGTQNVSYNSNTGTWIAKNIGQWQEIYYTNGFSSSNWTSNDTLQSSNSNNWYFVQSNGAHGVGVYLTFTLPNNPAVGVYMVEYIYLMDVSSPVWTLSVTSNGASAVNIRTGFNGFASNTTLIEMRDFFTITVPGQSCALTWTATGQAGGNSYYMHVGSLRITLLG